jgi:hypothetical protein
MGEGWTAIAWKMFSFMAVTVAGILMRHAHQASQPGGKFELKLFLLACLSAPALGVISGGVAEWAGVTGAALWAIVATVGFLGPAIVHGVALAIQGKLVGKIKP